VILILVLAFAALILLPALTIGLGILGSLFINGAELEKED
jgi:hypothetical protein